LPLAGTAAAPATATATPVTASTITSPGNGAELFYNGDNGSGSMTVRGTVTGGGPGTLADLRCYSPGVFPPPVLATGIDVSTGSFALDASLAAIAGQACTLRLVPHNTLPTGAGAAPFAGPNISVSDLFSHSATGNLYGYYILSGPLAWSYAFQSLGECPITASYSTDPTTLASLQLFDGVACLPQESGVAPNFDSRSAFEIDGLDAYVPGALAPSGGSDGTGLTNDAGFAPLSYKARFGPRHATVTIRESETAMICAPPGTFPPSGGTCPSLQDGGIRVTQTSTVLPGAQVARVSQRFKNVSRTTHTIDLLFSQSVLAPAGGDLPGFEFPGQETVAAHAAPDSFNEFSNGPGSIIVVGNSAVAPSNINPVGAITFYRRPLSADFISGPGSQTATFTMHYVERLRPGRSITFDWSYSQSISAAQLGSLQAAERDRFSRPRISISAPRSGYVSRRRRVLVTGRASDRVGVSSVTVNGHEARLTAGGKYTVRVRLARGRQRLTAIATNYAGKTRSTSVTVTYAPR
jgi:hypothetical protein